MKNQAGQLYRYDIESLIWICLYFNGPDDIPQGMEDDVRELWNLTEKLGTWVKRRNFDEIAENFNPRDCAEEVEVTHKWIIDIIKDYDYAHKSATEKLVTNDEIGPSSWP